MQRWGQTGAGKPRWFCKHCHKSQVHRQLEVREYWLKRSFAKWLTYTDTLRTAAKNKKVSVKTLKRQFEHLWDNPPTPQFPQSVSSTYIVLDALYLAGHHDCVLICRTGKGLVFWAFAPQETLVAWLDFLRQLQKPMAVVCDGQSGLLSAIQTLWPEVPVQRCLAHIQRLAIQKLTRRPHTLAGQELLVLVYSITKVKTKEESACWIAAFEAGQTTRIVFERTDLRTNSIQ